MLKSLIDFVASNSPIIGLLFFFVTFCAIAIYVVRPSNKKTLQNHANIPLKDKDE